MCRDRWLSGAWPLRDPAWNITGGRRRDGKRRVCAALKTTTVVGHKENNQNAGRRILPESARSCCKAVIKLKGAERYENFHKKTESNFYRVTDPGPGDA